MDKNKMLELIRKDRPAQVINEVIDYKEISDGFYFVTVDMEIMLFGTKILHTKIKLPYPYAEFDKLSERERQEWLNDNR